MDEKTLNEAIENVSLIKGVIDRTSKSFMAFSRIFIYWGLLFILSSIASSLMLQNKEQVLDIWSKYPLMSYAPNVVITLIAVLVYRFISKKIPLVGLEKHLMKLWILILVMNMIPNRINIINSNSATNLQRVSIEVNNFSTMIFSLSIALIVTSLFTGYKQLSYVGIIYIILSVLYAFGDLSIFNGPLIQLLSFIALPFTFLYTGFFLKCQQVRGV
jgi:hypothetical protein